MLAGERSEQPSQVVPQGYFLNFMPLATGPPRKKRRYATRPAKMRPIYIANNPPNLAITLPEQTLKLSVETMPYAREI